MSKDDKKTALRVGVFLFVALVLTAVGVISLGGKSGLFERKTTLYVHFADINGLVPGSPVRLAGLDVGTVKRIEFSKDLDSREARVELSIKRQFLERIRSDSRAVIDSKGLLGDKIINITLGTQQAPGLHDGDTLKTKTSASIEQLANKIDEAITSITQVSHSAGELMTEVASPQVRTDISRIVHSVAGIMEEVESGDGVVHRIVYDRRYADDVAGILEETHMTLSHLRGAVMRVEKVVSEVQTGDGTAHQLIYGKEGAQALTQVRDATTDLAALVRAVREKNGLLHTLIYDEKDAQLLQQWTELSERVNRITANVEKGRGTIGGLLVDPSVYEDMKTILGNIERNVLLKALIRYTIKEGDIQRPAPMPKAAPAAAP
jgi:phospholipid/cholesterol/gamma-HCH transport system substrate-binding protein